MVSELFFSQLALIALLWLCCMLHWVWPSDHPTVPAPRPPPTPPRRTRAASRPPFASLTTRPHCDAWVHASAPAHTPLQPHSRASSMTRGRRRQIDTAHQFGPSNVRLNFCT
jgi:hypothetical protein